jgi:uncharacterized protein (DUF433 family)
MKAITHKNELGCGIYTIPDISQILNINRKKVSRYISKFWDERLGKKLFTETYSWRNSKNDKAVNFYVLIELYTFFKLQEMGVTTRAILKARDAMIKDLDLQYPFASNAILTDGKKLWYAFQDEIYDADGSRQGNFVQIIESFAKHIEFVNGLAERYFPKGKESNVVVDPHHQFGEPVIKGTNISTEMLYSMYRSGEKVEALRIIYKLTDKDIHDAINFYQPAA